MKDPRTNITGLVLILCGAFLVITSRHVTPDAIAAITAGAGFLAAADAKKGA